MIDFLSISITNIILIILLIGVLILFCLYLYIDNKRLKEQLEEIRKENKSLLEKKIKNQVDVDAVSIQKISTEKTTLDNNEKINTKLDNKEQNISKEVPIHKETEKINKYSYYNQNDNSNENNFNLTDLINRNDLTKLNREKTIKEYDYLEEIQSRMNEELKPQTIELTDYEKKQEEQAVISYKELLRFKENNQYNDEKQETMKFIEELKNLRNSLK